MANLASLFAGPRPPGAEDQDPVWLLARWVPGEEFWALPDEKGRLGLFADRPLAMAAVAPLRDRFGLGIWAVPRWAAHAAVQALRHLPLEEGPSEPVVFLGSRPDITETGKAIAEHVGSVIRRLTEPTRDPEVALR